ncbi:MAG: ATP-dependent helicase [Candidatus Coproplasma sp.]
MSDILEKLNEEQIQPVINTEGPVLVLAGAGSGKTRVLTSRIAYILEKRLSAPSGILAITFTNKAANEMKERVQTAIGDVGDMWICTIHSMCVRILRRFGSSIGIQSNFSIYTESERANVIKKAVKELGVDEKQLKNIKFHIANAKTLGLAPDQYAVQYKDERYINSIVDVYEKYEEYLKSCNALDFDDLLIMTLRLLRADKEAKGYLSDKFRYILVDEFQDTNAVQYSIIKLLAQGHNNLFVVGDDDQSIYGWRGAVIENILKFDKDYPAAKVFKLQRNYRSTKSILSLANAVIAKNGNRHKKTLWTEAEEGEKPEYIQAEEEKDEALFAAKTINAEVYAGGNYSDYAVLMRINALTRSYESEFAKYGIPYKVFGGFKFFERKEIKDVLAYLRLISNPFDDEAFARIINVPKRGIGTRTLEIMEQYARGSSLSLYDACIDIEDLPLSASAKAKVTQFANLIKSLVLCSQSEGLTTLVRSVIEDADLKSAYDDGSDEGDVKLANLDEFIAAVDDFARLNPTATVDEYLNQVSLASDVDDMNDSNYVTLATIHSVKGLEFEKVFLVGLEDGILPTSRACDDPAALEEERRLVYVAVTRAKKRIWLTRSKSRYLYGNREQTRPSRFLKDMAGAISSADGGTSVRRTPSYGNSSYGGSSYGGYGNSSYGGSSYGRYGGSDRYGGYRNDRYSGYGQDGYEGDFWDSSSSGSDYSSDSGYVPDAPFYAEPVKKSNTKYFSAASTFGGGAKRPVTSVGKYKVGCMVRHPKFGVGKVVAVKNDGAVVDIEFENIGIKELSAAIAPLEIL